MLAGVAMPSVREWVAGSGVAMGFLDADMRFVEANAALASIFGVEVLGGVSLSLVAPKGVRTERLARQVLRTGRPITIGAPLARLSYYRVVDGEGTPLGVGVVAAADSAGVRHLAELKLEAATDGLTGLVNHRGFQERLRLEFARAHRHGRSLSLAMVDVDGFKLLNDTFGHQVGDDALQRVAGRLAGAVRTTDTVARVGGDEFALLLPETSAGAAEFVVGRAHEQIRRDATWLLAITHHKAVDAVRREQLRRAEPAELLAEIADERVDLVREAWLGVQREHVRSAVASLTDRQREVIELAYYEGYSQAQLAQLLEQPLGTVKSRTHVALARLRASLEDDGITAEVARAAG